MTRFCMQGLVQSVQLSRHREEVETPTSNQPPHGAQDRKLLGPAALRSCPFASLHGQARARLGPRCCCRCSGNGGPQTCLPAACGVAQRGAQLGPSSPTQNQDPREGPSLAGRTTRSFLRHGLVRLAHEEAESSRRGTSQGAHDASHDDQGHRTGASRALSFFPLWCKGSKRRREHQAKASISVQQDQNGCLCLIPLHVFAPFAPKRKQGLCVGPRPPGTRLASVVMACVTGTS